MSLMAADMGLVEDVRSGLAAAADPARAERMRRYMKSTMPYWGVPSPLQGAVYRAAFAAHPLESAEAWRDTVMELWRGAGHREERYAAITLAAHRAYRAHRTIDALPLYEEMIVAGAWWDLVDGVSHLVGELLRREPEQMRPVVRAWARDPVLWKRRSAIICQVGARAGTDFALLRDAIEPNLAGRDFFIRKAIGWALRDYAWSDPQAVRDYVAEKGANLSGLSRREALRNLSPSSPAGAAAPSRRGRSASS